MSIFIQRIVWCIIHVSNVQRSKLFVTSCFLITFIDVHIYDTVDADESATKAFARARHLGIPCFTIGELVNELIDEEDTAAAGAGGGLGKGSEVKKNPFQTSADDDVSESSISDDDNTSGHVDRGDNEDEMSEAGNGMKYCQRCNSAYVDAHEIYYNGQLEQELAILDFEQCKKNCTAKGCASNS